MSPAWTTETANHSTVTHARFGPILIAYAELIDGMGLVVISDERPASVGGTLVSKGTYTANAHVARRIAERLAERLEPPVPLDERYHGGNRVDYWVTIPGLVGVRVDARATVIGVFPDEGNLMIQPDYIRTDDDAPPFRPPHMFVGKGTPVPLSRVTVRY